MLVALQLIYHYCCSDETLLSTIFRGIANNHADKFRLTHAEKTYGYYFGVQFQQVSIFPQETLYELLGLSNENAVNNWIARNNWKSDEQAGYVLVCSQDESIKTKKITEKIDLESVAGIMASSI